MTRLSRRRFLRNSLGLGGLLAAQAALPGWMPRLAFAQPYDDPRGDVLISIFLRGGADALNMIVPHAEDAYYNARPRLAIARPDDRRADQRAFDLDGFFGLHPALAPLLPAFQNGDLLAVHATGSLHGTRSHFEAMDVMERGTSDIGGMTSGWIGRHLAALSSDNASPLRGVGWGTALQTTLSGAPSTVAMQSIIDYHLGGDTAAAQTLMQPLMQLYALGDDAISTSAQVTAEAIDVLQRVGYERYVPRHSAEYPETNFARALRQTAALIRADVGLEAACIDLGGWDTHANQGAEAGTQARLLSELAEGLAAFHADMGPDMAKVTVVIMSEFGRRLAENASQGTDHGYGGAMLVMSASFADPQPVIADWPGLVPDALDKGRDLAITTDYRDVLADVLLNRLKTPDITRVFPEYTIRPLGLFA